MKRFPLNNGRFTLLDDDSYERLVALRLKCWAVRRNKTRQLWYAVTDFWDRETKKKRRVYIHRWVMNPPRGMVVDHINGDGLDNRRVNMRVVKHGDNLLNRHAEITGASSFIGVAGTAWGAWRAYAFAGGKQVPLGCFATEIEAACARDYYMEDHHSEFARFNFEADARPVSREAIRAIVEAKRGTSRYRGVRFKFGKWEASLRVGNNKLYLGRFRDELEAARARDAAVILHRDKLPRAKLNFPAEEVVAHG